MSKVRASSSSSISGEGLGPEFGGKDASQAKNEGDTGSVYDDAESPDKKKASPSKKSPSKKSSVVDESAIRTAGSVEDRGEMTEQEVDPDHEHEQDPDQESTHA